MNDLLPRLEAIVDRYNEVGKQITDPGVIADMKRYPSLMKEYKDLGSIVETYNRYKKVLSDIQSAKELMSSTDEAEMKDLAQEELNELLPLKDQMDEEIQKTLRTASLKSALVLVAMKLPFLQEIYTECTLGTLPIKVGSTKY